LAYTRIGDGVPSATIYCQTEEDGDLFDFSEQPFFGQNFNKY